MEKILIYGKFNCELSEVPASPDARGRASRCSETRTPHHPVHLPLGGRFPGGLKVRRAQVR